MEKGSQATLDSIYYNDNSAKNRLLISVQLDIEKQSQKNNFKSYLEIIDVQIQEVLDVLVDKLPLNTSLLSEYLPHLIKSGFKQLNAVLMLQLMDNYTYSAATVSAKANNIFIKEIVEQMKELAKGCPVALLAWIVVLSRFSYLLNHTNDISQYDSVCNLWRYIAASLMNEEMEADKVGYHLACLSSLLLKSG